MKLRYLILALIILSIASVFIGVFNVTPLDIFTLTEDQKEVLLISRLPRLFSILIAGANMSITGLIMQQLRRNKIRLTDDCWYNRLCNIRRTRITFDIYNSKPA